ncbi:hypothetical protein DTO027B9_3631 [Paecilomyces variotii]|nr:hypothetical protein DTO027B9_3631 [Paecilomyces variotii]
MAHPHGRPAQEVVMDMSSDDEQPTVAPHDLMLQFPGSNDVYSNVSHPTHVPTSTSPTSLGAYEHHDFDPMDSQYEQTESSLQDLTQIGSGLTVNADPASVLEGTEYLQNWPSISTASDRIPLAVWGDELEQRRMNAIWSLWGFPDDGPQLSYADTLRQLERRDKVNDHYRSHSRDGANHSRHRALAKEQIDSLRRLTDRPAPRQCRWCRENVVSWDGLVNCMIEHGRLPEQSDDISGNSVNNGNGGNPGGRPGDGNNRGPGPAGGGSSGMPQQGSLNYLSGIDRSIESSLWNLGSSRRSSQSTSSTEPKPKFSERDSPFPAGSVIDDGDSQSKSQSDSIRSDVLQRAVKTKDRKSKRSRQDIPPRECRKCGHIVGSYFNCPQDGTATFGCHKCNHDGQAQLRPLCLVGGYGQYKGNVRSLSLDRVSEKPCIHPAVKNIDRSVDSVVYKGLLCSIPPTTKRRKKSQAPGKYSPTNYHCRGS